jgi:hypothetical protein
MGSIAKSGSNTDNVFLSFLYVLQSSIYSDEASLDVAAAGIRHHVDILSLNKLK